MLVTAEEKLSNKNYNMMHAMYECTIDNLVKLLAITLSVCLLIVMVIFSVYQFKLKGMEFVSSLIVGAHVSIQFWMDTHEESYSSEVSKTVEKYCAETNHHHDQILKSI
ncbi:predicted protein [Naegleria gruberi]|uniref:Predicted protein n=1 Tax=Naegleria gruberi TaxID=5762 RepID=D2V238_NAEGR|nr:uncharacterized protein NAEGRDRAFT_62867 [Naegleria gruberi]EFC48837.1 predicted protein [Naegleria gruberi]|eukprot:XP_002681581.1 predicted protein [Naegleria gruberi strain NEG-M]